MILSKIYTPYECYLIPSLIVRVGYCAENCNRKHYELAVRLLWWELGAMI